MAFVHLHNHSEYSILDGMNKITDLVSRARALQMDAVALTDHGFMYGAIPFYRACFPENEKENSGKELLRPIKPIIGCEIYTTPYSRFKKEGKEDAINYHLILLAKSWKGYQNLCKLVSKARIEGFYYKPRADFELLEEYHEDIIALSACIKGQVPYLINEDRTDEALKIAKHFKDIFGSDYYFEIQNHFLPEEKKVMPILRDMGKQLGISLVATQDAHYPERKDAFAHDILLCVQTLADHDDPNRLRFSSDDYYLKSEEEMTALFSEFPDALHNTNEIADRCNITIEFDKPHLPKFQKPGVETVEERTQYLRALCDQNLSRCYGDHPSQEVTDRLQYELKIVEEMQFVDYFLVVQDFINYAKRNKIAVGPGRGSAAGSVVSYLLNITSIDPLQYHLFFERFLNPERINMPDIDIDFEDVRRGEVITYVREKYGQEKVAQVATFGKMESRASIRDTARAFKFTPTEINIISKTIPFGSSLEEAYRISPDFKAFVDKNNRNRQVYDTALQLEGITRNFSVHAAGVVIGDEPLWNYVPLTMDKTEESYVTQYDKDIIEKMGLLKIDFLGLRNLSIINDCIRLVETEKHEPIDLEKIPMDDPKVFSLYQKADTAGMFQVESRGMRQIMKELQPNTLEDVIALIALYRPGPMVLIKDFIKNKQNPEAIHYDLPELKPILENTYGICVYQEQVMQIARTMAGFSLGQADILRKAMGKKKKELMDQQRKTFVDKSVERGYSIEIAEKIFDYLQAFAGYGFNRAHAAAYGVISYQTAYLKAHYPMPYMASLLNSVKDDEKKLIEYIQACRESGIEILPPSINKSELNFSMEENGIRFGLLAIKSVGKIALDEILLERQSHGPYLSFAQFLKRAKGTKVNKKVIENLVKAGAFDTLDSDRKSLLNEISQTPVPETSLFDTFDPAPQSVVPENRTTLEDKMAYEKEAYGFYLTCHPFTSYKQAFFDLACTPIEELEAVTDTENKILFGRIEDIRLLKKRNGNAPQDEESQTWLVTIGDLTGSVELFARGKVFQDILQIKDEPGALVAEIRIRSDAERQFASLLEIKRFISQEEMQRELQKTATISLRINLDKHDAKTVENIVTMLKKYPGECPIDLKLIKSNHLIHTNGRNCFSINRNPSLLQHLEKILGQENVWYRKC